MGPVLGIGQVVHELVQHISTGGRQVYPFRCDHVIHKLFQHISTEGGSEQEGNLSFKVFLYKGLQYMLSCMIICHLYMEFSLPLPETVKEVKLNF